MTRSCVLVAMSGGVDSAVAAARLVDHGDRVVGVTFQLADHSPQLDAARAACDHLGIVHHVLDRRELFDRVVVEPFVAAYLEGRTPSPCAGCNRAVKIHELLELADRLGIERVATGHYARLQRDEGGAMRLYSGCDPTRDQSYFLCLLEPTQRERLELPLGPSFKRDVRAEASSLGLPQAEQSESRELCFVADDVGYAAFVEERAPGRLRPGAIIDSAGRRVGDHPGIHRFTVGQRKGLGVALGAPAFVIDIDPDTATVTVGSSSEVGSSGAALSQELSHWDDDVSWPAAGSVKIRSQHRGAAATLERTADRVLVRFDRPVRAVSPGQLAVAYHGERVLGGGTIDVALRDASAAGPLPGDSE